MTETKTKPKCYIAGKIGDLKPEEFEARFAQAEKEVMALGFEPVSPLKLPHQHGRSWAEYMREDLTAMLQCQMVFALDNHEDSPGATIEIETAQKVGIGVIYQKAILNRSVFIKKRNLSISQNSYYKKLMDDLALDKCFVHFKIYDPGGITWRCQLCGTPGTDGETTSTNTTASKSLMMCDHSGKELEPREGMKQYVIWRCGCGETGYDYINGWNEEKICNSICTMFNLGNTRYECTLLKGTIEKLRSWGYTVNLLEEEKFPHETRCEIIKESFGGAQAFTQNEDGSVSWVAMHNEAKAAVEEMVITSREGKVGEDEKAVMQLHEGELIKLRDSGQKVVAKNLKWKNIKYLRSKGFCISIPGVRTSQNEETPYACHITLTGHVFDRSIDLKGNEWFCVCGEPAIKHEL